MKKAVLCIFIICAVLAVSISVSCVADTNENVSIVLQIGNPIMTVNGDEKEIDEGTDTAPVIIDGRTLVPIRAIIEEMGGSVNWDSEQGIITLNYNDDTIILTIDSTNAVLNDNAELLDTPPVILNGRTFLPVRFISESFGFDVSWDGSEQIITISGESGNTTDDAENLNEISSYSNSTSNSNILIAYFSLWGSVDYDEDVDASTSASIYIEDGQKYGTTEIAAKMIQENVGGDLFRIETEELYSDDFETVIEEARTERGASARPLIKNNVENIEKYDTIFIGYPVWSMTVPNVILTFIEEYDLSGKTIIPFCTHNGYGAGSSFEVIEENATGANVNTNGIAIESEDIVNGNIVSVESDVADWIQGLNLSSGDREEQTAINIIIGDYTLTGYLNNTPEAEQFMEMLPVTISMAGYGGREYYGGIEDEIESSTEGKLNFENGDITYCPENNTVAIFYAQTDRPNLTMEVISMGMVTSDLAVFDELGSSEDITFELA